MLAPVKVTLKSVDAGDHLGDLDLDIRISQDDEPRTTFVDTPGDRTRQTMYDILAAVEREGYEPAFPNDVIRDVSIIRALVAPAVDGVVRVTIPVRRSTDSEPDLVPLFDDLFTVDEPVTEGRPYGC